VLSIRLIAEFSGPPVFKLGDEGADLLLAVDSDNAYFQVVRTSEETGSTTPMVAKLNINDLMYAYFNNFSDYCKAIFELINTSGYPVNLVMKGVSEYDSLLPTFSVNEKSFSSSGSTESLVVTDIILPSQPSSSSSGEQMKVTVPDFVRSWDSIVNMFLDLVLLCPSVKISKPSSGNPPKVILYKDWNYIFQNYNILESSVVVINDRLMIRSGDVWRVYDISSVSIDDKIPIQDSVASSIISTWVTIIVPLTPVSMLESVVKKCIRGGVPCTPEEAVQQ